MAELLSDTTPIEIVGEVGDVCYWHHRLVHSPGVNCSGHDGVPLRLRTMVPVDWQKAGLRYIDHEESNPGPNAQWFVDTRAFEDDVPPGDDMWAGWGV